MVDFKLSKLYGINNKKYLSELLKVELSKLKDIETHFSTTPFYQKNQKGKRRRLYNPHPDYKKVLQRLNIHLSRIVAPDYVLGGIKKRSYVMNANLHKENDYFLLLDLKDFFPSTRDNHVYYFFRNKLKMSQDIAKICTLLTTEPSEDRTFRHLPQGYSTSPYLSFLSYFDMYNGIKNISDNQNIIFSCYYDDLTFSSKKRISFKFKETISNIVADYHLTINKDKTRFYTKKRKVIKITGAIINKGQLLKAPNSLQKKMYIYFKELTQKTQQRPVEKEHIIKLCNKVIGCLTAIQHIEPKREFPHIRKKVKEIRKALR
ncbi:RNA-directed DNA polymerase [Bacillus aerolatus]|uniref:RNA-directed DNA polymerase n=1 Tax=Bacillus aerolatus TaxID=2653354 RepID=A0A6I1FKG6_9BACI|nr:reverse transcriptase family protein [Bacillus aerolatus]KAB7706551.1 RNA-directed DNA polymerase [Bacillus aerolatus]